MPKTSSDEEVINHYGAVRLGVVGSGNLLLSLRSLSDVKVNTLLPLTIRTRTNIEPTRLANFTQQKALLEVRTVEINEIFSIDRIIVFVRPVAKSYPGQ